MVDLFELLDVDGGGQLTQHEFVEGLLTLGCGKALEFGVWGLGFRVY